MKRKVTHYRMDMEGKEVTTGAIFLGAAFFLRVTYYFGFCRTNQLGFGELFFGLILPMLLELALIILLRGVKLEAEGLYGLLATVYCVILLLQCFQYDSIVRAIIGMIAYILCGGLCFCAVAGLLSRDISVAAFFVTAGVRLIFLVPYILKLRLISLLPEAAGLCAVCAMGYFMLSMNPTKK